MKLNEIQVPYGYLPRPYQVPFWRSMESGCKRAVLVRHRRAGKDLDAWNFLISQAVHDVGTYFYIFPELGQARKAIFDGFTNPPANRPFLDFIPKEVINKIRNDEMKIQLHSLNGKGPGSIIQFVASERVDNLVGSNIKGGIFSEFAIQNKQAWDYLQPSLLSSDGFAIFPYTPRGRNHGYELFRNAQENPNWFCERLTIDDTRQPLVNQKGEIQFDPKTGQPIMVPVITQAMIDEQRRMGMSEELIQQEYYCSFDAPLVGAYFAQQIRYCESNNRIDFFSHTPGLPVHTAWDIGISDKTSIWFFQEQKGNIRLLKYYEKSDEGLPHFIQYLKEQTGFVYGTHLAPHDIAVRDWTTGVSRFEAAQKLGITFTTVARLKKEDQIEAARGLLSRCYFDRFGTAKGVDCLKAYSKQYDHKKQIYKDVPEHNYASHAADAFMTLACGFNRISQSHIAPQPSHAKSNFSSRHRTTNQKRPTQTRRR